MEIVLFWIAPIVAGLGFRFLSKKSRGKNAKNCFKMLSLGMFLLLLGHLAAIGPLPGLFLIINLLIWMIPSAICFTVGASHMIKEMRAQRKGEYTDIA